MTFPRARVAAAPPMALGLAFIYVPLVVVLINSFNADRTFAWPPRGLTPTGGPRAWDNAGAREALWTSVQAGSAPRRSRWCSAPCWLSPCSGTASSAGRRCRC